MKIRASELVAFVLNALAEAWGYVLGGQGEVYSKELAEKWAVCRNKPRAWIGTKASYFIVACARWFGRKIADCSGLIIAAIRSKEPKYADQTADGLYSRCTEKGDIKSIPEIPWLCVHKPGHIGVYVGGGYVIESRGYKYGVVKTKLTERPWTGWGKLAAVDYTENDVPSPAPAPAPAQPVSMQAYRYDGATYTNLRKGPGVRYADIGNIGRGDVVEKLGEQSGWWKVKTAGGEIGFCSNTHLFKKVS